MKLFSLDGKIALVTGPSKGLGKAMAIGLAEAGANVVGIGIDDMKDVQYEIENLGKKFYGISADLSNIDLLDKVIQEAIQAFGKIDILLNNAGIIRRGLAEEQSKKDYDVVFDLNVKALYMLTQRVAKHMIKNQYGKIINIGSIQSLIGGTNVSPYVASKHAVGGFTKALANEWGSKGINVNAIAPGFMITDNTEQLRQDIEKTKNITERIPMKRWGNIEDLKGPVVFLASDESKYVNGHILVVDGGYINN